MIKKALLISTYFYSFASCDRARQPKTFKETCWNLRRQEGSNQFTRQSTRKKSFCLQYWIQSKEPALQLAKGRAREDWAWELENSKENFLPQVWPKQKWLWKRLYQTWSHQEQPCKDQEKNIAYIRREARCLATTWYRKFYASARLSTCFVG